MWSVLLKRKYPKLSAFNFVDSLGDSSHFTKGLKKEIVSSQRWLLVHRLVTAHKKTWMLAALIPMFLGWELSVPSLIAHLISLVVSLSLNFFLAIWDYFNLPSFLCITPFHVDWASWDKNECLKIIYNCKLIRNLRKGEDGIQETWITTGRNVDLLQILWRYILVSNQNIIYHIM